MINSRLSRMKRSLIRAETLIQYSRNGLPRQNRKAANHKFHSISAISYLLYCYHNINQEERTVRTGGKNKYTRAKKARDASFGKCFRLPENKRRAFEVITFLFYCRQLSSTRSYIFIMIINGLVRFFMTCFINTATSASPNPFIGPVSFRSFPEHVFR